MRSKNQLIRLIHFHILLIPWLVVWCRIRADLRTQVLSAKLKRDTLTSSLCASKTTLPMPLKRETRSDASSSDCSRRALRRDQRRFKDFQPEICLVFMYRCSCLGKSLCKLRGAQQSREILVRRIILARCEISGQFDTASILVETW